MAMLSIASLISFFLEENKSIQKGENHHKSDHVEAFSYQQGILHGKIHASMETFYKVTMRNPETLKTVYSFAHEQLHLNKAKL